MTQRRRPLPRFPTNSTWTRREFLDFMGRSASTLAAASALPLGAGLVGACTTGRLKKEELERALGFRPIAPSSEDALILAEGLRYQIVIGYGDRIRRGSSETFGYNNDFIAYFPIDPNHPGDGLLWVNHEYPWLGPFAGITDRLKKTRAQVVKEQEVVGGTIIRVRRDPATGDWEPVLGDKRNRRITAKTPIPLVSPRPIAGRRLATGTLCNCAGGVTPWGTVLTCEENYHGFYGERDFATGEVTGRPSAFGWDLHFDYPPEHYGWVVEVNPQTGQAKKLTALGRFSHEGATVRMTGDGRCAVYMGDDKNDECIYKFIAEKAGSLDRGILYAADIENGRWLPLDMNLNPKLSGMFRDSTHLLIHTREAAHRAGASRLDRPEDIEIDPATGAVICALTNNLPKGNDFGSLLKIEERDNDPLSLEFNASTFIAGGKEAGFAAPDNLAFDPRGGLWLTTDISGSKANQDPYVPFGNNGLFYIPMRGPAAGQPVQVASAPVDAEFTGPCFSPDGRTLFLSVQHPGETSKGPSNLTSHWPAGGNSVPRPCVVAISGPTLDRIAALR